MLTLRLYLLQRVSALIMAPLVLGHLVVMIYAIRGGLSAADILSRTRGSLAWGLFYGSFVVAVSVHAAIGLRVITTETIGLRGPLLDGLALVFCAALLVMGLHAVLAVTIP
jgi:fumarate reductase subunit C